jgi:hypothetical protein
VKPSTRALAAAAVTIAGATGLLLWALPRMGVWFGGVQTGLEPFPTRHFTVYASDRRVAEAGARDAEKFAEEFVAQWGELRGFKLPDPPVPVYLFDNHDALARYGMLKMRDALENNGGYWSPAERILALVRTDRDALWHELTHMLVSLSWPGAELSPWFSEGHAQWHEAGPTGGPPGTMLAACRKIFADGKPLPLVDLLAVNQSAFKAEGNTVVYAESAALFAWLAVERRPALDRVFDLERRAGRATPAEFAAAVGTPLEQVEREWREWVRSR